MKFVQIILFFLVSSGFLTAQTSPVDEKILNEASAIFNRTWDQVWPELNYQADPTIIVLPPYIAAYNLPCKHAAWEKKEGYSITQEDPWGLKKEQMNPQFQIEGKLAFVFQVKVNPYQHPLFALVHEKFHSFQFDHFKQGALLKGYPDLFNLDNLALMQIEDKILADWNRTQDPQLIQDWALLNSYRSLFLQKDSLNWEDTQEKMEGLADYVAQGVLPKSAPPNILLSPQAPPSAYVEHAMKWRYYGVGSTLGHMLDSLKVNGWKKRVAEGTSTLREEIDHAVLLDPSLYSVILERYQYEDVKKRIAISIDSYRSKLDQIASAYAKEQGITIQLESPPKTASGGDSQGIFFTHDGTIVTVSDRSQTISDDSTWQMNTNLLPAIYMKNRIKEFKEDENLVVYIDGQPLLVKELLSANKGVIFHSINWKGKYTEFKSTRHGELVTSNGVLEVHLAT